MENGTVNKENNGKFTKGTRKISRNAQTNTGEDAGQYSNEIQNSAKEANAVIDHQGSKIFLPPGFDISNLYCFETVTAKRNSIKGQSYESASPRSLPGDEDIVASYCTLPPVSLCCKDVEEENKATTENSNVEDIDEKHPNSDKQETCKQAICACQRDLIKSNKDLKGQILQLEKDLAKKNKENWSLRAKLSWLITKQERLQKEIHRLAAYCDSESSLSNDTCDFYNISGRTSFDDSSLDKMKAMELQVQMWEKDVTEALKDSDRLRIRCKQLSSELRESKRIVQDQQHKILLYSQLLSTSVPSHLVLATEHAPLRRTARSLPSSPLEKSAQEMVASGTQTLMGSAFYGEPPVCQPHRPLQRDMDFMSTLSISDVVPRCYSLPTQRRSGKLTVNRTCSEGGNK